MNLTAEKNMKKQQYNNQKFPHFLPKKTDQNHTQQHPSNQKIIQPKNQKSNTIHNPKK